MKIGNSESLLNFAQRLRDRIFAANVVDENSKITFFINALEEPLKSQLNDPPTGHLRPSCARRRLPKSKDPPRRKRQPQHRKLHCSRRRRQPSSLDFVAPVQGRTD